MNLLQRLKIVRSITNKWLIFYWGLVILLFGVGLVIRFYDLNDPPLDFQSTRQMHSFLIARGMYYQNLASAPQWQRDLAVAQWNQEGLIEPPIMESLTALTYQLFGEQMIVPRVYSILFWMLGGIFLFCLVRDLAGPAGSVVSLAYFLTLPYGAIASRAFQPDPLLTMLLVLSLWSMLRWDRRPTWKQAIATGIFCGLTIFTKAVAAYFIGFAWFGLLIFGKRLKNLVRDPMVWVMGVLTILPYAIFHIYGVYISGELVGQFELRFFPQLWLDPVFYLRWNGLLSSVVGFEWFLISLTGIFLMQNRGARFMWLGIWVGYFALGMTLSYHISTHDYYNEPLIPVVAVGLGVVAEKVYRNLQGKEVFYTFAVVSVMLFWVTLKAWDVRVTLKRMDYQYEVGFWTKLGDELGHSPNVVGLTHDNGYRLAYWGWMMPTDWMTQSDFAYRELAGNQYDIHTMFCEKITGKDFFVVTLFQDFDGQPELKQMLVDNYAVFDQTNEYMIYDLHRPKNGIGVVCSP